MLFIDGPDQDNFMCVLGACRLIKSKHPIHVVLTGRPLDFRIPHITPAEFKKRMKAGMKLKDILCAKTTQTCDTLHSQLGLNDLAVRLTEFLRSVGVTMDQSNIKLYDGCIAPTTPLNHGIHCRDYLFDRTDMTEVDEAGKKEVLSGGQYYDVIERLDSKEAEERSKYICEKVMRSPKKVPQKEKEVANPTERRRSLQRLIVSVGRL